MKKMVFLILCACCLAADNPIYDPTGLAAPGAQLQNAGAGWSFTEGPAVDKAGNIFFTDQPNNTIHRWDAVTGKITAFLTNAGRSNGMYFDKKGFLITCADMQGEVWSIDQKGNHTVLVKDYKGKLLNGPNDLWINPVNGGMYFTDPLYPRDYWEANDPRRKGTQQGGTFVYYLSPDRKSFTRVVTDSLPGMPNGVVGSPDGKKLYVGVQKQLFVFDIQPNGTLANRQVFAHAGGDGLTMDAQGNVYLTNSQGVTAFNTKGEKIFNVPTGEGWTANVVFGGKNRNVLFITALQKVFTLQMKVKAAR